MVWYHDDVSVEITRCWYHDDVSFEITRWWYHDDVSVEMSHDGDIMMMCMSNSQDDDIMTMCLSNSQDDDIMMMCMSKSQYKHVWTKPCQDICYHYVSHYLSKSQDDDIMMCLSKSLGVLMSIVMKLWCDFRRKSLLVVIIDVLIYVFHTHFDRGLKVRLFCSPQCTVHVEITRWWYHDDVSVEITIWYHVSVEITGWWYHDDVSVWITRWYDDVHVEITIGISWWCVCWNHNKSRVMCGTRLCDFHTGWYHDDVSVEITRRLYYHDVSVEITWWWKVWLFLAIVVGNRSES